MKGVTVLFACHRYVCDLERGRVLSSVHAHEDAVSGMAVQQGLLFSSSWDSMVKVGLLFVLLFEVST